jgi:hypothetical protein
MAKQHKLSCMALLSDVGETSVKRARIYHPATAGVNFALTAPRFPYAFSFLYTVFLHGWKGFVKTFLLLRKLQPFEGFFPCTTLLSALMPALPSPPPIRGH